MCQEAKAKRMKVVTLFPSEAKKGDLGFLMRIPKILEVLWYFWKIRYLELCKWSSLIG
jgi:hypothetical protein